MSSYSARKIQPIDKQWPDCTHGPTPLIYSTAIANLTLARVSSTVMDRLEPCTHKARNSQQCVATSSTHAEINGAYTATLDIIHFRNLLQELGYSQIEPTPLMVDNQSLITLCTKFSGSTKAVKHIMMRINFMIEQVNEGIIALTWTPTEANTAIS